MRFPLSYATDALREGISFALRSCVDREGGRSTADMSNFTMGMVARGYSDQEIKKILGLNFLKLFKRVWGA